LVFLPPLSLLPMRASRPWLADCDRHLGIVSHPHQREERRGQEEAPRDHSGGSADRRERDLVRGTDASAPIVTATAST
jgi:hypothetical protein